MRRDRKYNRGCLGLRRLGNGKLLFNGHGVYVWEQEEGLYVYSPVSKGDTDMKLGSERSGVQTTQPS